MSDINKLIGVDPDGVEARDHLADLEDWDEALARTRAAGEDLDLTDAHLQVLHFLRNHYIQHGPDRHARDLRDTLDSVFEKRGGIRYLYTLFPRGPVGQGSRLAGLPVPAGTVDASSGSVQ
jgi:tRNA 2-thiouridine synthesizing protein E